MRLRIAQMRAVSDNNLCRQTSPTNIIFYLLKRVKKNIDGRELLQSFNTALNRLDIYNFLFPTNGRQTV